MLLSCVGRIGEISKTRHNGLYFERYIIFIKAQDFASWALTVIFQNVAERYHRNLRWKSFRKCSTILPMLIMAFVPMIVLHRGGDKMILSSSHIEQFSAYLLHEEKSEATQKKYLRDLQNFFRYAGDMPVSKELVLGWKRCLIERGYAVRSINSMLASLNSFLGFLGLPECKSKHIRMQKRVFCVEEKELTKAEYLRLLQASKKDARLNLVLQAICATGIRVSELRFFTVEAVRHGEITVDCKNKTRTILVPGKLKSSLLNYAKQQHIASGPIFVTRTGKPLNRSNIWAAMKKLCASAGVLPSKLFPHNLRKLFARAFYAMEKDIAKLADILGHSSIDTTRIYIMTTAQEHRRQIERLGLVV